MDTDTVRKTNIRKTWNILVAFLFTFNMLFGTVPPASAQAPAPTISTDKADYQPGETVLVAGANWQDDTEVKLVANDSIGQTWQSDVTVTVQPDGSISASFLLPSTFVAEYTILATGVQTGRTATTTFTDAPILMVTKSASPVVYNAAGDIINYSYVVQNTGNQTATNIVVADDKAGNANCPSTSLAANTSMTCTASYTITANDVTFGYVANHVTVTAAGGITSNTDVKIASIPVTCRNDSDGANDVVGQKDLTMECASPTAVNPMVISWNWDIISQPGSNSADGCALFDTNNNGLANYAICVSWLGNRVMQPGYPILYQCTDAKVLNCSQAAAIPITNGTACAVELANDDPFPAGDSSPLDTKAFCSINLADVGGASKAVLIDVCSYTSASPSSNASDCVVISAAKGNLEVIKDVVPDAPTTNWNINWTGPTTYSGTITGDGTTGIQTVDTGNYNITETAGTGTDLSLYDTTWACTVDGAASTSGTGTTITGRSVAKGSVVICTFTNTRKTGSLEIKKDVIPDNAGTNWNFAVTGPDPTFTSCSIAGDGTCGAKTVFSGSYSITETAGSGTILGDYGTSWACTVNGAAGPSGTGTTLTGLTINKSDVVVCTFTNSQAGGTITVNKVVVPSADAGKFNLQIDGTTKASDVGNGGTTGAVSVSSGSHTVGETAGTVTDLANYVTTITGDCDSAGNVTVGPNENKTCTITNTRKGSIVIKKVTDPAGQAGDFTFTGSVSGTIQDGGTLTASNLAPGSYSVTETTLASNFSLESISCDDTNSTGAVATKTASITLDAGETVTCTFTNKKLFPNLAVAKTADVAAVTAGDAVGFSISVTNNGAGTATNVTLSDTLPAIPGVTWSIASQPGGNPCALTGTSLSCTFGNLAPGATAGPVHITGTSASNSCGTWNNTATAQADNNTAVTGSASIIVDCATIKIAKTAGSSTVSAGDSISYTITVTNDNSGTAHNVTVTDTLPTNAGLGDWTLSGADAGACSIASEVLTCNFSDVAGHASKTVTLTASTTAATCGTVSNKASVTTSNDGSDQATATVTVQCPSLSVTKTPDAASVSAGDTIGYTITVSNAGPGVAKGVALSDSLPGGLAWSIDAGNTTATGCAISGSSLTCGPDTIASGSSVKVHVTAASTPAVCGTLTNTATATPTNGDAATSQASTIDVLCPDLTVTKTGNGPISAGDTATYTIMVTNSGLGVAKGVTISDSLPGGLTWTIDAGNTTATGCAISGSTLTCGPETLAANASVKVTVSAVTTKTNCGTLTNSASAAATNEQNTSNNSSGNVDLEVDCATIQIEKTTSTPTVSAGDQISYTITVTNPGLGTAKDVVVTDSLPGGLTWTITPAISGCSISGSVLTCNFGSIATGGSASVTVTATTTAVNCGTLTNTASVTTSNDGAATTPATDITVQCPHLSVTKAPDSASVSAGDTIGYTITVSNAGPGKAKGVAISDSLPGGLAWSIDAGNTTATGCAISSGVLSCGPDTIASGSSVKVHVTAASTPAVCGTLSNSATATPTNGDAATSQTTTITVLCPDLTVTKTGNGPISAGDTASFTIEVKNTGLGEAKNVTLTDTLPTGVTWALTPAVAGCSVSSATPQVLSCSWATLATGADIPIVVSGATSAAVCGRALTNGVTLTADNEANIDNNSANASIQVDCATIQIEKTTTTPSVSAGTPINFTIKVSNPGAGTARNVVVTDSLPTTAGLTWTISPAVSGCSITGTTLTCNFGDIAKDGSKSVTLTSPTTSASCGTISNTAIVTTTNDGSDQATASVTVNCPDLTVTKSGNGPLNAGDTAIYTITITNSGTGDAAGVTLSDTLPAHIAWSVDNAACGIVDPKADPNVLSCSFGTLAAGASITIHVSGTTSGTTCGPLSNTVTVAATNEADTSNNSATGSVTVNCATIGITKTAQSPISAGDTLTYTITVTNTGAGTAYGVTVIDTLPTTSGLGPWTVTPDTPSTTCAITSGVLNCTLGDMAAGATQIITLSSPTTYDSCGAIFNEAGVQTTNDGVTKSGVNVVVQCPKLTITKTADSSPISLGQSLTFTIMVTNNGTGTAKNVVVTDQLPNVPNTHNFEWMIGTGGNGGECTLNYASNLLTCNFGNLAPGASKYVRVSRSTDSTSCETYTNTATASADNHPPVNSSEVSITVLCTAIAITKVADSGPFSAGDTVGFTITVTNPGPGSAFVVKLTDTLPTNPGLNWQIASQPSGNPCSITGGVLNCSYGTMDANSTRIVHITSTTTAETCGVVNNSAHVSTVNDGSGDAADSLTVNCPDLTITKTPDAGPFSAGDTIGYTITITNSGTGKAYGVSLSDTLPTNAGLSWSISPAVSGCSIASGVLTCDVGTLKPAATFSVHISSPTTPATCGATVDNTATVTATNEPGGQTNNGANSSITVNCPSLTVTKKADATSVNAGDVIGFTITVANGGPGVAKSVNLTDTLPSGSGISWGIAGGTGASYCQQITGGVLTCSFGDMAANASYTVHVTSPTDATSCGKYNNTATVTSTNQADVTGTDSVTVNCATISITKTTTTPTVSAGQPISYTLVVTNGGDGTAHNVTVTDILPNNAGLNWTVNPAVSGCSVTASVLTCNLGDLAGHASQTITLTSPTTYASCATLSNTASVTTSNDGSGNSEPATITVNCPALAVTKTPDAATVSAGDQIGFTITVTNTGDGVAKNVTLSDTLQIGLGINWGIASSDPTCTYNEPNLTCSFGDLAKGVSKSVHITSPTTAGSCTTYKNTATASADNQPSVTSPEASVTVQCAGIAITKVADHNTVSAGDTIGFTIEVTNPGPGTAYGVKITDTLPTNPGLNWTIDPPVSQCSITSGVLTCDVGTLPANKGFLVHISSPTTAGTGDTVANTAHVSTTNDGSGDAGDSITVNSPDIVVTKTAPSGTVNAGDPITFQIQVKNIGLGTATNVVLTDTLPTTSGLSWTVGGPDASACTVASGVLTCTFATLPPNVTATITLTSPTTKDTCAKIDNTASATASNEPTGQPNNSSTASITVNCAAISITKTTTTATVSAGDPISYTITVTNGGDGVAHNVTVTDTLPSKTGLDWKVDPAVTGCAIAAGVLTCNLGDLAGKASQVITLTSPTTYASCGTLSNTASVTTSNDGSATSEPASITVNCPALQVTKTPDTQTVSAGQPISFTITVKNNGSGTAKNVTLSDQLPLGVTWSVNNSGCNVLSNGVLTCGFNDLGPGASTSVTVTGDSTPAICGTFDNTATIKLDNGPDVKTNTVSVTVNCADVTVTKAGNGPISAGDIAAFKIVVTNSGVGTAYNVTVNDTLPAGIAWTIDPAVTGCSITGGVLSCSFTSLAAAAKVEINVSGATSAAFCGTLDNTVTVAASNDVNPDNNTASASITVNCADVTVTKTGNGPINAGDNAVFKIVVSNTGTGTAYNVAVNDTLPAGITWTIDPAVTGCDITGNTLSCAFTSLAAGAKVEITVSGKTSTATCGRLDNTVTVSASNEVKTDNNSASASITVNCADVTVTKQAVKGVLNAGDTAQFKIVVTNSGPGMAYGVQVSDPLPSGTTWKIDPPVTGCAITNGTLFCQFSTLAANASVEINVVGAAPAVCGKIDNTVTVTAANDVNPANNSATASITVVCPDVEVEKEGNGPISAGDKATFEINVENLDVGIAYNVNVTDQLPAGLTWTIDPPVSACSIDANNKLTCHWDALPTGLIPIHVSAMTSPANCGVLNNTVTITASNEPASRSTNNTASSKVVVNCPDLKVTKTAVKSTINAGEDAQFDITIRNLGADSYARNITLTDTLPGNLTWTWSQSKPAATNGGCTLTGNTLSCAWDKLDYLDPITVHLKATTGPANCGTLTNTVTVVASNEANTANNTATATITVKCALDLTISKTADPAYKRTFNWSIAKSVDKAAAKLTSGSTLFNYTVTVKETGFTDSNWVVTGKITVTNPNAGMDVPLTSLTDSVNNGGTCTIVGFTAGMKVPAGKSLIFDYKCTYTSKPAPYAGVNTVTVGWSPSSGTPHSSASATANFNFEKASVTKVNETATITDTFDGTTTTLGKLTAVTTTPYTSKTFTYSRSIPASTCGCKTYTNKAKIVETGQVATATVSVCGPMKTGALTIGYWQNKNGQGLIKNAGTVNGACKLALYLRQYAPFQDLISTASCYTVATYVYNVIKAASAGGATMNAMLKAQMLATALDVYFSDPNLGGNKINAPAPIGGLTVDLTTIRGKLNVGAAFGGAKSMKIKDMLAYAASQSNVGGSVWYNNNKTTQGLAKDAFDAINNQQVYAQ